MPAPINHAASLGTPEGRKAFFLHLLKDSGQSAEGRVRALDEFFIFTQREAYQAGWNDAMRPRAQTQNGTA
jgi:hypothetical protein